MNPIPNMKREESEKKRNETESEEKRKLAEIQKQAAVREQAQEETRKPQ